MCRIASDKRNDPFAECREGKLQSEERVAEIFREGSRGTHVRAIV